MTKKEVPFSNLVGKTIVSIGGIQVGSDHVGFETSEGLNYSLKYYDGCCASASINEIHGDVDDLLNSPILLAEEVFSNQNPTDFPDTESQDSFTWTFYKLSTIKGSVTIRWYGESNGYYSETATFEELT